MVLTSLALFASALSFNVSFYDTNNDLISTHSLSPSYTLDEENNYSLLHYSNFDISPYTYLSADTRGTVRKVQFNCWYSTSDDTGNYQKRVFTYELSFVSYNGANSTFTLSSSDYAYIMGYFGQSNLYVDRFMPSVRDFDSNDDIYYISSYYDYLYYDNLDTYLTYSGLGNSYQILGHDIYVRHFDFSLVPSNIYNQLVNSKDGSYSEGYSDGQAYGYDVGYSEGSSTGYTSGYADAKQEYEGQSETVTSIFQGILSIGLIPVEFFMSIFNFSVLGVNITSIVSAILTLMVLVILMRIILGGKGKE